MDIRYNVYLTTHYNNLQDALKKLKLVMIHEMSDHKTGTVCQWKSLA